MRSDEKPQYPAANVQNKAFKVHILTDDGIEIAKDLATRFDDLLTFCEGFRDSRCNEREMELVTTKLEEACFFAKKSLAQKHSKKG